LEALREPRHLPVLTHSCFLDNPQEPISYKCRKLFSECHLISNIMNEDSETHSETVDVPSFSYNFTIIQEVSTWFLVQAS
jgi:hypothetical protein